WFAALQAEGGRLAASGQDVRWTAGLARGVLYVRLAILAGTTTLLFQMGTVASVCCDSPFEVLLNGMPIPRRTTTEQALLEGQNEVVINNNHLRVWYIPGALPNLAFQWMKQPV